jgi:hypothetical protein
MKIYGLLERENSHNKFDLPCLTVLTQKISQTNLGNRIENLFISRQRDEL